MRGDRLDLTSEPNFSVRGSITTRTSVNSTPTNSAASENAAENSQKTDQEKSEGKKYVGVRFHCCSVYVRVYVNKSGTAYEGRCPKCAKPVRLKIGEGGTNCRIFDAY